MRTAVLLVIAVLAVWLGQGTVLAASPAKDVYAGWNAPGPPPLERFVAPLRLTLAQQEKLKTIFEDARVKAVNDASTRPENHAPNPAAEASTVAARETEFRQRLATVLTAGQLELYEKMSSAHLRSKNPAAAAIVPQTSTASDKGQP